MPLEKRELTGPLRCGTGLAITQHDPTQHSHDLALCWPTIGQIGVARFTKFAQTMLYVGHYLEVLGT
jgi:hypothetical protein